MHSFTLHALALAFALVGSQAFAQSAEDWPMYNHDVAGSRHNPREQTLGPENVAKLEEKWRFPAEDTGEQVGVIHATPAVVDGYVYFGTVTNPAFYKLTPDGKVRWTYRNPAYGPAPVEREAHAWEWLDPAAGDRNPAYAPAPAESGAAPGGAEPQPARLQPTGEGSIFSSALVTEDTVYFGDLGGWFYALDRATGQERWKLSTRGDAFPGAHPMYLTLSSPILADGKLIIAGGTLEQLLAAIPGYRCCTGRGFVAALEPKTGDVLWKYDVGPEPQPLDPPIKIKDAWGEHVFHFGPATSSVWSTPSFDAASGTIFFGTDVNTAPRRRTDDNPDLHTRESCAVIALDVRDGTEKWVTQINPADVWNNAMISYDPAQGRYKDQSIGDTPKVYSILVDDEPTKVVGVGCKNGGFYVLRADDGQIVDHTPIYTGAPTYPLSPEPDPRTIAMPSALGGLQTGCATDGKTIYTNGFDALWLASFQQPAPAGGPITAGRVVALSADTRTEHWRHERPKVASLGGPPPKPVFTDAGDPVASGIAVANGVVYFTTVASGKLVALDGATGAVLKEIDLGPVWSGPSVSRGRVYVGTGNTQLSPSDEEAFFPKKYTGVLYSFGLPGEDEVSRLEANE